LANQCISAYVVAPDGTILLGFSFVLCNKDQERSETRRETNMEFSGLQRIFSMRLVIAINKNVLLNKFLRRTVKNCCSDSESLGQD
jgi:hypothetical protein